MSQGSESRLDKDALDVWDQSNQREQDAARALKSALIGVLFLPLQIYTLWLLFLVAVDNEPLRSRYFWYASLAAAVLLIHLASVSLFIVLLQMN